jgi:ferric iron reductase protein FhuF
MKFLTRWKLLKDEEIPDNALNQEYVDKTYSGLVYKTYAQLDMEQRKKHQQIKSGWIIFYIWLVVIPAIIAIIEYYSDLLALIALIYALYKAVQKGLELTGKWPKSKKEKEHELEERLKNHYYYHCQMNPAGFRKLMLYNLDKMSESEIAKEAELLK